MLYIISFTGALSGNSYIALLNAVAAEHVCSRSSSTYAFRRLYVLEIEMLHTSPIHCFPESKVEVSSVTCKIL